jgi:hypothetical protein
MTPGRVSGPEPQESNACDQASKPRQSGLFLSVRTPIYRLHATPACHDPRGLPTAAAARLIAILGILEWAEAVSQQVGDLEAPILFRIRRGIHFGVQFVFLLGICLGENHERAPSVFEERRSYYSIAEIQRPFEYSLSRLWHV